MAMNQFKHGSFVWSVVAFAVGCSPLECTVMRLEHVNPCKFALRKELKYNTSRFPKKNVITKTNIPWTRLILTLPYMWTLKTQPYGRREHSQQPWQTLLETNRVWKIPKRVVNSFMSYFKRINDRKRRARAPVKKLEGQGQVHCAARRGAARCKGSARYVYSACTGFLLHSGNP